MIVSVPTRRSSMPAERVRRDADFLSVLIDDRQRAVAGVGPGGSGRTLQALRSGDPCRAWAPCGPGPAPCPAVRRPLRSGARPGALPATPCDPVAPSHPVALQVLGLRVPRPLRSRRSGRSGRPAVDAVERFTFSVQATCVKPGQTRLRREQSELTGFQIHADADLVPSPRARLWSCPGEPTPTRRTFEAAYEPPRGSGCAAYELCNSRVRRDRRKASEKRAFAFGWVSYSGGAFHMQFSKQGDEKRVLLRCNCAQIEQHAIVLRSAR